MQTTVKEHYDNHLGNFYSWMTGDFETNKKEFQTFLKESGLIPATTKIAIDLGAGHGIQSVPLAKTGFKVIAVDFNEQLLDELKVNAKGLIIEILNDDIQKVKQFENKKPELIVCCGDTIAHLGSKNDVKFFLKDISNTLVKGGRVLLSFRDYSRELKDNDRFILVKSDETRILTCVLEYDKELVRVTDLLHEKTESGWKQKSSSYNKVRVSTDEIVQLLEMNGMKIQLNQRINRLTTIIAIKP